MIAVAVPHLAEADPLDHMLPIDQLLPPVSSESAILSGASASRFSAWKNIGLGMMLGLGVLVFGAWITLLMTSIELPDHTAMLVSVRGASSVVKRIPEDILIPSTWKESARAQTIIPHLFGVARTEDGAWNAFTIAPRWISIDGYRETRGFIQIVGEKPWKSTEDHARLGARYAWNGARFWSETSGELRVGELFGSSDAPIIFRGSLTQGFLRTTTPVGSWEPMKLPLADVSGRGIAFQFLPILPACNSLRIPMTAIAIYPTSSLLAIQYPCKEQEMWMVEAQNNEQSDGIATIMQKLLFPEEKTITLEDETSATERLFGKEKDTITSQTIGSHTVERVGRQLFFRTTSTKDAWITASCGNSTDLLALSGAILHRLLPTVIDVSSTRHFVFGETDGKLSLCWMK